MQWSDFSAARLVAQQLAGPAAVSPAAAVSWLGAVQGQDLPGALVSVALRSGTSVAEVVDDLNDGKIVRTWPMRGTLHLVAAEDVAWMCAVTADRMFAQSARRREQLGLTEAMLQTAGDLAEAAIAERGPLTRTEVLELWEAPGFTSVAGRGYHLLSVLCYQGRLVQGPMRGKDQCFANLTDWVAQPRTPADRDEALAWLAKAYFRSHGPATLKDLSRWLGLTMKDCRTGLALVESELVSLKLEGQTYWMAADLPDRLREHRAEAERLLLLPGFDEIILGYADRSCTLDRDHEKLVVPGNNGMFKATIVHQARVIGTWQRVRRARGDVIKAAWFDPRRAVSEEQLDAIFGVLPQ